jgi:hypothetical protein
MAGEETEKILPRDGKAYEAYVQTWGAAGSLYDYLLAACDRSPNHRGEYLHKEYAFDALKEALDLDWYCQRILADPELLTPEVGSPEAKYDFQAGIYIAHHILPFSLEERGRLCSPDEMPPEKWARFEESAGREPELVERWHQWIWTDAHGHPTKGSSALGASAILGVAAWRLTESLSSEILGWHIEPLDDCWQPKGLLT